MILSRLAAENPALARAFKGMTGGREPDQETEGMKEYGRAVRGVEFRNWRKRKFADLLRRALDKIMTTRDGRKIILRGAITSLANELPDDWRMQWIKLLENELEHQGVEDVDSLVGSGPILSKTKKTARVAPEPAVPEDPTISESKLNTKALERLGVFKPEPPRTVTDTSAGAPTLDEDEMAELEIINEIQKWKFWRNDAAARRNTENMKIANDKIKELEKDLKELRKRSTTSAYSTMKSFGTPQPSSRRESAIKRVSTLESL